MARGYGIPFSDEIEMPVFNIEKNMEESQRMAVAAEKMLKQLFPNETRELEDIADNIKAINDMALVHREDYREKFDQYLTSGIRQLAMTSEGKRILSNPDAIREKLGKDIVTTTEVSNLRIKKLAEQARY